MSCCISESTDLEKDVPHGIKPHNQRSCTDILFTLLFIASFAGVIVLISKASAAGGNPQRLLRGIDYLGRICGVDTDVADLPYAAWSFIPTTPEQDYEASGIETELYHIKICVADCTQTQSSNNGLVSNYDSSKFLYYCVPDWSSISQNTSLSVQITYTGEFQSASQVAAQNFAALITTWPVILIAAFAAIVVSYLYIYASRALTGVFVWVTILLLAAGGFMVSYALLHEAYNITNNVTVDLYDRATILKGVGWTFAAVTALFVLIVFALRNRIRIAVEVVKEAARSIADIPLLPFFPIVPMILLCAYMVLWIYTAVYIFSVEVPKESTLPQLTDLNNALLNYATATNGNTTATQYTQYTFNTAYQRSFAYLIFQLLWTIQFAEYFCFLITAYSISQWYFTQRDPLTGQKIRGSGEYQLSHRPILSALHTTIRFHIGTIAFAALIIALIQSIRACIKYIEEKTVNANGQENRVQKCVFCCIQSCLYCVQCCMDKINKNALVWTAMYGDNLCVSAYSSFKLIWSNLFRAAALNCVSVYIMTLGKFIVSLIVTGASGSIIYNKYGNSDVASIVLPMIVIFAVSYGVASLFITIFETAADTIFLCFLIDEQLNGANNNMFASPSLLDIVHKHSDISKEQANKQILVNNVRSQRLGGKSVDQYNVQNMAGSPTLQQPLINGAQPSPSPPPQNSMMTAPSYAGSAY